MSFYEFQFEFASLINPDEISFEALIQKRYLPTECRRIKNGLSQLGPFFGFLAGKKLQVFFLQMQKVAFHFLSPLSRNKHSEFSTLASLSCCQPKFHESLSFFTIRISPDRHYVIQENKANPIFLKIILPVYLLPVSFLSFHKVTLLRLDFVIHLVQTIKI